MKSHNGASDANVTPKDLAVVMMSIREEGIGKVAAGLLEREPVLGNLIVGRWNKVQAMLSELGLSDEQSRPVLVEVCRLIVEPWVAMERSHRRMWDDFCPLLEMAMKINDVVRIHRVPHHRAEIIGHLLGEIGFIEEMNADRTRVFFQGLKLPGLPTKVVGWIAVACLEPVNDPAWAGAVVEYQRWFAEVVREHEELKVRWWQELQDVAAKHKLTVQEVREIVSALEFNGAVYE